MAIRRGRSDATPSSVHLLYRALEEPECWDGALTALADELQADHVILDLRTDFSGRPHEVLAARVAPFHIERFAMHAEYAALRRLLPRSAAGFVLTGEAVVDRTLQSRSEFYADVIRPMGGYHSLFAMTRGSPAAQPALFAACRSARRRVFETQQLCHVEAILPHLETALRLRRRLSSQGAEMWWRERALSLLPVGVILLDGRACPCYANPAAEAIVRTTPAMSLSSHAGLSVTTAKANGQLRRAIQAALKPTEFRPEPPIRLPGANSRTDIWLRVMPLVPFGSMSENWSAARVAVFCDGPDSHPLDAHELSVAFGFTSRETALAQALLMVQDLPAAARALGIGLETARSQLKSMFLKTETNRQAELTYLLATMQRWSSR